MSHKNTVQNSRGPNALNLQRVGGKEPARKKDDKDDLLSLLVKQNFNEAQAFACLERKQLRPFLVHLLNKTLLTEIIIY